MRFQPTKRPQISTQKSKPKPSAQKAVPPRANAISQKSAPSNPTGPAPKPVTKATLADWTADVDDDVNDFFGGEKRQRGGRKKRKKNKEESTTIAQNWDDIYDPSRPNSYEEYKNSDEKISELREWKDKLYAHRMLRWRSSDTNDSDKGRFSPQKSRPSVLKMRHSLKFKQITLHLLKAYPLHLRNSTTMMCRLNALIFPTTQPAKMPMLGVYDFHKERSKTLTPHKYRALLKG